MPRNTMGDTKKEMRIPTSVFILPPLLLPSAQRLGVFHLRMSSITSE